MVEMRALGLRLMTRNHWLLTGVVLALVLMGFLLLYHYWPLPAKEGWGYYELFTSRQKLRGFVLSFKGYSSLAYVSLQAFQVIVALIPGEFTGLVGGFIFGALRGFLLSMAGLTLGSTGAFLLARRLGRPLARRFVKDREFKKFDFLGERSGAVLALIIFIIPGFPKDAFCYVLGLSKMKFSHFFLASTLGRIPGTIFLTLQGSMAYEGHYLSFLLIMAAGGLTFVIFLFYRSAVVRWIKSRF